MQDPLEVYLKAFTCPFCQTKFQDVVRLIPDCGSFICDACNDELTESLDRSKKYKCDACQEQHVMPVNGLPACKQLAGFLRQPIEKPLSEQAKRLKELIENVQDDLANVEAFDPRDYIEHHFVQLELEVNQAAEKAVKHINQTEADLLKQIQTYRKRCLDSLTLPSSVDDSSLRNDQLQVSFTNSKTKTDLQNLSKEIKELSIKWTGYFKRLNALATERQLEKAINQADIFLARIKTLDQEMRNEALCGTRVQFNPKASFHSVKDHLGELLEVPAKLNGQTSNDIRIGAEPLRTVGGHSVREIVFLPDGNLAICSLTDSIRIWNPENDEEPSVTLHGHKSFVYSLAVLSNGWLASSSADKTIKLWNLAERKEVRTLQGHTDSIMSLRALKNGNLVSFSHDDTLKVWNPCLAENNLLLTITGHENKSVRMNFAVLSNSNLVTCSRDASDCQESVLRVWDRENGKLVKHLQTGLTAVCSVLALSNDQVAICSGAGTIKVLDLDDSRKTRAKLDAHSIRASYLMQLSNGNLVSAGLDKDWFSSVYLIKVWRFCDLSLLQQIDTGHTSGIYSMSVSRDESLIASGSSDSTVKIWPINSSTMPMMLNSTPNPSD